jgi:hypothetical protein
MLKSSPIFKRNGAHLVEKKRQWKKTRIIHSQSLNALNMQKHFWFLSSFDYVNFAINGKYSKKLYHNPNYHYKKSRLSWPRILVKKFPLMVFLSPCPTWPMCHFGQVNLDLAILIRSFWLVFLTRFFIPSFFY